MTGLIQSKKQLLLHENEITGGKSIITNVHEVINAWSHSFLKKKKDSLKIKLIIYARIATVIQNQLSTYSIRLRFMSSANKTNKSKKRQPFHT